MKTFLLIILSLSITSNCFCQTITGIVLDTYTKKPLDSTTVYLTSAVKTDDTINVRYWYSNNYKIILQTTTDATGKYRFGALKRGKYNIMVEHSMPINERFGESIPRSNMDANITIKAHTHYRDTLQLMVTCMYDKTKDQPFCPICKKSDQVVPIQYGLPEFDSTGNYGNVYLGGCVIDPYCNPKKHCNRCNINF